MEEKEVIISEAKEKDIARYSVRFNLEDERQYQTICGIEQEHQKTGKSYNDIFIEALGYWIKLFQCDEYPDNINLVAMYFQEIRELEMNTKKKRIRNLEYEPETTKELILEKYLEQVNSMPKLQFSV